MMQHWELTEDRHRGNVEGGFMWQAAALCSRQRHKMLLSRLMRLDRRERRVSERTQCQALAMRTVS
jgi:hypothetical protein